MRNFIQPAKIIVIFFLFLFIGIIGCEKERENDISNWENSKEGVSPLILAKNWYNENTNQGNITLKSHSSAFRSTDNQPFFTNPSWKYYAITENDTVKAIDVDLTDSIQIDFVSKENYKAYQNTGKWEYSHSHSRLVILQSKKRNATIGFIMTIIPSPEYIHNKSDRIRFITYLNREPDFDGIILFHNTDGTFSNGWIYKEGKINNSLSPITQNMGIENMPTFELSVRDAEYSLELNYSATLRSGEDDTLNGGCFPDVVCTARYPKRRIPGTERGGGGGGGGEPPGDRWDKFPAHIAYPPDGGGGGGGGGGGYSSPPPPPPPPKTPCQQTKDKLNEAVFKSKLSELRNYLKGTLGITQVEKGYVENRGSGFTSLSSANGGTSLNIPVDRKTSVGYIHNHTDAYVKHIGVNLIKKVDPIQMFSPADVIKFLQMAHATSYNGIPTSDVYGTVVTSGRTYMLKFTGNPASIVNVPSESQLHNDYLYYFTKLYKNNPEEAFLNFVKDKMQVTGIQLLKVDNNDNVINLNLNNGNSVVSTNCP